jgi:hypothetical protein
MRSANNADFEMTTLNQKPTNSAAQSGGSPGVQPGANLFVAEGDDGVDRGGAACGEVGGEQRNN